MLPPFPLTCYSYATLLLPFPTIFGVQTTLYILLSYYFPHTFPPPFYHLPTHCPAALGRQANRHNFLNVHRNFSRVCDAQCQQQTLDFDVPSLADLCRRGTISQVYGKCAKVSGTTQARS